MKNKFIYIIIVLAFLSFFTFKAFAKKPMTSNIVAPTPTSTIRTTLPSGSEKIEVIHFHATQQCWSCITLGEYTLKTIKDKFPKEYHSGKIIFKDVNSELIENREVVVKFQAGGSSLFVNATKDGQDHIEEDVTVWRLITNESQFTNYFESKIKKLL
jgi:hypothetical protein